MIELKNDQLLFSFPALTDEIRRLYSEYESEKLPRILSENRRDALRRYLKDLYCDEVQEDLKEVACLRKLTDEAIENAFRAKLALSSQAEATFRLEFQRTLRLPDDGKTYFLPPGLGRFPLRHVDDHAEAVPTTWIDRGGVMMPMYQSEALWLRFHGFYPIALKIGAGKINAVTGEEWREGLHRAPQNYMTIPGQPWLDGFSVAKGVIRQFVATPLGEGGTVEEQVTGKGEFGGVQVQVYPMKARVYFDRLVKKFLPSTLAELLPTILPEETRLSHMLEGRIYERSSDTLEYCKINVGLGMGGRMKQEIYRDRHGLDVWDLGNGSRCFVHLCNALQWREITGTNPPQTPVTAKEYERARLPWFDYYREDLAVLEGSKTLAGLKSLDEIRSEAQGTSGGPDAGVTIPAVVSCGPKKRPELVREWVE